MPNIGPNSSFLVLSFLQILPVSVEAMSYYHLSTSDDDVLLLYNNNPIIVLNLTQA